MKIKVYSLFISVPFSAFYVDQNFLLTGVMSIYQVQCYQWGLKLGFNDPYEIRSYADDNGNEICSCITSVYEQNRGQAFRLENEEWIPLR